VKNYLRIAITISLIVVSLGGITTSTYFLSKYIIRQNYLDKVQLVSISIPEIVTKGDNLEIILQLEIEGRKGVFINSVEFEISSLNYGLNGSVKYYINKITEHTGDYNLTIHIKPLLNSTDGYFAMNVGEYQIESMKLILDERIPIIERELNYNFNVINPTDFETLQNGDFQNNFDDDSRDS
jgi:hypothetical protein